MESNNPYQTPSADIESPHNAAGVDTSSPFSADGRFSRLSYLGWALLLALVFFVIAMVAAIAMGITKDMAAGFDPSSLGIGAMVVGIPLIIAMVYVGFVFAIRRLHDMNASGWWSLLMIVPLVSMIMYLVLAFKAGTDGPNRYGPARPTAGWEKILGYIMGALVVLGFIANIAQLIIGFDAVSSM